MGSLLAHWLAVSLFQGSEEQLPASPLAASRIAVFLDGRGHGVQMPNLPGKSKVRSEPVRAPYRENAAATPAEAELPQAVEELYVDPKDVDQMAFATEMPELPLPADENVFDGSLRVKILIGKNGRPDGIEVLETTFPEDYVSALVSVFSQGVFQPAMLNGKPVKSWRVIDVIYGEVAPASNQPAKAD